MGDTYQTISAALIFQKNLTELFLFLLPVGNLKIPFQKIEWTNKAFVCNTKLFFPNYHVNIGEEGVEICVHLCFKATSSNYFQALLISNYKTLALLKFSSRLLRILRET